jgi:Sulfotransferase domain
MTGAAPPQPNFFIVGAPKAGTTSLYEFLRSHPDVFMPDLKEPHFFGSDHRRLHHAPRTWPEYLALFAPARGEPRIGEASSTYLHSTQAAREIHDFDPAARIIIMLRDPVDVAYALHGENVVGGFENVTDFEVALAFESERRSGRRLPDQPGILETLLYRDVVAFASQVERYFDAFSRDQVHVLLYDDWIADPGPAFGDVLRFLDLEPLEHLRATVANPSRRVRNPALRSFVLSPSSSLQRVTRRVIPQSVRARMTRATLRATTVKGSRPPMSPELRAKLRKQCEPDVARLAALLDADLSRWSRGTTSAR